MEDADLFNLSVDPNDASVQEKARAMAAALRQRRAALEDQQAVGQLGQWTGNKQLAAFGGGLAEGAQAGLQGVQQGDAQLAQVGERRLQRKTEGDRNAALAQYHMDTLEQRRQEEARKAAEPKNTVVKNEDGVVQVVNLKDPTQAPVDVHTSTKKLSRPGGTGAPEVPVTLETAAPWEIAAAKDYDKTRTLPPLGRDVNAKKRILTLHGLMFGNEGAAGSAAQFQADKGSLGHLQTQADAVGAFEATALRNLGPLEEALHGITDTGSPLLNKPIREIQSMLMGDPRLSKLEAARQTFLAEAAKINSGQTGSGGTPISVRDEIEKMLPPNATLPQFFATIALLKQDMHNRHEAVQGQLDTIRGRMSGKKAPAEAPQGGGKQVVRKQQNKGLNKTRITYSDGSTEDVDGLQ